MSIVKSFSVGNGDTFYIKHNSNNFTIIDCCLSDDEIISEIKEQSKDKSISRFISTHPDLDHIGGLKKLNNEKEIINFYCVENEATKKDENEDFLEYCKLRDSSKAFFLYKGCSRCWMNEDDNEKKYGSSGINILWPVLENEDFKEELKKAKKGESPNNISPIIKYSLKDGATVLWMGDLESDFIEKIKDNIIFPKADILFAPHHGRESGKLPEDVLKKIDPKIIIIGEAPCDNLNYYSSYQTITQNSAGDITFDLSSGVVDIYVSNENYKSNFSKNKELENNFNSYYLGSFDTHK